MSEETIPSNLTRMRRDQAEGLIDARNRFWMQTPQTTKKGSLHEVTASFCSLKNTQAKLHEKNSVETFVFASHLKTANSREGMLRGIYSL